MTGMNIVLINLTRFGDLLQSQAAIADLAARGHRVAVVCLENFAGAASLLHGVMHISALPSAGLLAALDKGSNVFKEGSAMGGMEGFSPCADWAKALGALAAWKKSLLEVFPVDAVCNLTPTLSARLLARFVAGDAPCTGFAVDAQTLPANARATHISLFDGTLQGFELTDRSAFGFQGHPEESPGPHDINELFDKFISHMAK